MSLMILIILRTRWGVTDGNLASHLKALEENNLIRVNKQFIGRKPNTSYSITENGASLFHDHIKALEGHNKRTIIFFILSLCESKYF